MQDRNRPEGKASATAGDSFLVLVNREEQYSLWPADQAAPKGWKTVAGPQPKADCAAYIDAHWTDMRPKSLRSAMDKG
ncbi:MbtH family protein [Phenylobacterium sp.]|jgi:MbtH protein|uniref:MbtH family protein n=1 Tax=Phenylobacterium sp. TaxID=1871053 RepID=UPI002F427CD1